MPSNEQPGPQKARHAAQTRIPTTLVLLSAALAVLVIGALVGYMLTTGRQATPRTQAAALSTPSPIQAARALRAVRDLERGDAILYYPVADSPGLACTFVSFPDPSPKYATADCGNGYQQVKVCDIASITPATSARREST